MNGPLTSGRRIICICHDIEGPVDSPVSEEGCQDNLVRMLGAERAAGVPATYNVLGTVWREKAPLIAAGESHALGFHSYNHNIGDLRQLPLCRRIDPNVKGYRPPRSQITPEISDQNLRRYNFHWLLSSARSLGFADVRLENGIVKIPVHLDDYPIYRGKLDWNTWERQLLHLAETGDFVSFGLHDCYAHLWIDRYASLLERLASMGEFHTCDRIADRLGILNEDAVRDREI